jgi:F-type H+-transporting ATPase subunit b
MSPTWVTFLFEAANFLLLAGLLGWLFFRPVRDVIERSRAELAAERSAAEEARTEADRILQETREKRAELEGSLEELRARVQREADQERERLVDSAREQVQRERDTLKGELVSQRRAQSRSLVRDAMLAAREIVVRLLEEMGGPDLEQALIRTACRELAGLSSGGSLQPIVVESARALEVDALDQLTEAAKVQAADVSHRVDPDLIAGVRVLTARGLVDVSAAGLAAQAERVLVGELERENQNDL